MSNNIIQVESLSKSFLLHHEGKEKYTALRDVVSKGAKNVISLLHKSEPSYATTEEFWALKDVSFNIEKGARIGVIGRNGAGKSTLLKILSRITEPSSGKVILRGRVASLLEVGTGFHPELTGRENVFLNGAILGMSRKEIRLKFDEIVAFAEVEKFLDTPVKRYSSGMYVRLAFAVAAHLEPEILIVDEVLAVGDAQFQKKCLGKMEDVSKSDGRTVIFVSHNMSAIQNLCTTAIYLNKGSVDQIGNVHEVIDKYLNHGILTAGNKWMGGHKPNESVSINSVEILSNSTTGLNELYLVDEISVRIKVRISQSIKGLAYELFVRNNEGSIVFSSFTDTKNTEVGEYVVDCIIPPNTFNNGRYIFTVGLSKDYSHFLVKLDEVLNVEFHNSPTGYGWQGEWPGVLRPKLDWSIKSQNNA
jgi:lipopolysaccharide transport system ATP-binding protein